MYLRPGFIRTPHSFSFIACFVRWLRAYSTVTDFARFRGWSTSIFFPRET